MPRLRQRLPDGPLDIVGDIHGELEPLLRLLFALGVDLDRQTAGRPLVFVGDLIDRGPDSVGVVEVVVHLVEAGLAHVVAGNHELNALLGDRKEGNGWLWGSRDDHWQDRTATGVEHVRYRSRAADGADRDKILAFFAELPLVLEREDLRVVHACPEPAALAALPESADLASLARSFTEEIRRDLKERGIADQAAEQRAAWAGLQRRDMEPTCDLPAVAEEDVAEQSRNPVKVVTSGLEERIPFERRFYTGGKWRLVRRSAWWQAWNGPPVVVGHYWRRRQVSPSLAEKDDVWVTTQPWDWAGPRGTAFCVDYSVGRRFVERHRGNPGGPFDGGLAALRWPERQLLFEDVPEPVPTRTP
jgi:hypothetical protein